jgi:hypothetical protein
MKLYFKKIKLAWCWGLILCSFYFFNASAQNTEPTPYYLNINQAGQTVHKIKGNVISLQYHDKYGEWREMPLSIYNWKRERIAQMNLSKSFGVNNFVINLFELGNNWELNKVYLLELLNEHTKITTRIQLVPLPDNGPEVNISVNPIQFQCDLLSPKLLDFYGEIRGGKAPYEVQWFVLNNQRNDFLYQPTREVVQSADKTMVISVDKTPDYYVIFFVIDACGNKEKKTVHVVCEDGKKTINTLFVEPINKDIFFNAPKN